MYSFIFILFDVCLALTLSSVVCLLPSVASWPCDFMDTSHEYFDFFSIVSLFCLPSIFHVILHVWANYFTHENRCHNKMKRNIDQKSAITIIILSTKWSKSNIARKLILMIADIFKMRTCHNVFLKTPLNLFTICVFILWSIQHLAKKFYHFLMVSIVESRLFMASMWTLKSSDKKDERHDWRRVWFCDKHFEQKYDQNKAKMFANKQR